MLRFHSANKIDNRAGRGKGEKEKKSEKNLQNKSKHKNNRCFSWVTAVRVLSLAGSHSPLHLPRMPSNTVLVSGPAVRAAQILIWSCSGVLLPPLSTAIRTSVFFFCGSSQWPFINPHDQLGRLCVYGIYKRSLRAPTKEKHTGSDSCGQWRQEHTGARPD